MSELSAVISQIKPCDTTKPYIFVSYSSKDAEVVLRDVLHLQQNGWNVWVDTKNMDGSRSAWQESALEAIQSVRCCVFLFYVSSHSLFSTPCLEEWQMTYHIETRESHCGEIVPTLIVEVEPIDDIKRYRQEKQLQMVDQPIEDVKKYKADVHTSFEFLRQLFKEGNNRLRIRAKDTPNRYSDYYEDIQDNLRQCFMNSSVAGRFAIPARPLAPAQSASTPVMPARPVAAPAAPAKPAAAPKPAATGDLHTVKTLGTTDIKYSICTFGSKFDIGAGAPVTLVMGGQRYERKMHNVTKGRVDSMKKLYTEHGLKLGDVLDAHYCAAENTIYLTKLDSVQ